jgi:hypothetical protein
MHQQTFQQFHKHRFHYFSIPTTISTSSQADESTTNIQTVSQISIPNSIPTTISASSQADASTNIPTV